MFEMNWYMYLEVNSNIYAHMFSNMNDKKLIDEFRLRDIKRKYLLDSYKRHLLTLLSNESLLELPKEEMIN